MNPFSSLHECSVLSCNQEIAYLMYNDEPAGGAKSLNHGHTKGKLAEIWPRFVEIFDFFKFYCQLFLKLSSFIIWLHKH